MNIEAIQDKLLVIIKKVFKNNRLTIDSLKGCNLSDDLGMESMIFMEIIIEIEDEFGICIPDELLMIENFVSYENIVRIIESTLGQTNA